jgi:hypothetical protein
MKIVSNMRMILMAAVVLSGPSIAEACNCQCIRIPDGYKPVDRDVPNFAACVSACNFVAETTGAEYNVGGNCPRSKLKVPLPKTDQMR